MNWQKNDKCLQNYRAYGIQNENCLPHSPQLSRFQPIACVSLYIYAAVFHIQSYSNVSDEVLDRLKYESSRLLTFDKWPASAKVEPRKIAKAGFFYTGQYAEAKCLWCNCVITTWDYGDQVCSN